MADENTSNRASDARRGHQPRRFGCGTAGPVAALPTWLEAAGITEGAVFRAVDRHGRIATSLSDRAVALIVKRRAAAAGVDPTDYSAHSLRAGCATEAAARGVEKRDIGRHTRHRSIPVLRGYIRAGSVFVNNASGRLGL